VSKMLEAIPESDLKTAATALCEDIETRIEWIKDTVESMTTEGLAPDDLAQQLLWLEFLAAHGADDELMALDQARVRPARSQTQRPS
jgi:hypothetical protein